MNQVWKKWLQIQRLRKFQLRPARPTFHLGPTRPPWPPNMVAMALGRAQPYDVFIPMFQANMKASIHETYDNVIGCHDIVINMKKLVPSNTNSQR